MINCNVFPVIDLPATGRNIERLRRKVGLTVRDIQTYFGFEYPQAVYKWQHGECLPSVDNLLALARLLQVPMEDLLVYEDREVSFCFCRIADLWGRKMDLSENMRHNMDYGLFRRCLTEGCDGVDETEFFILDEPEPVYCILGYLPEKLIGGEWKRDECPYWIGHGCDVKDGLEFATAEELLHAKVYGGRSLAEVWDRVYVENLGMVPPDIWFETCPFSDEVFEENGVWKLRPREQLHSDK